MITYRVLRFCCRSGMCLECRAFLTPGKPRTRVVHADGLTEDVAKKMLRGWANYEPTMEPETEGAA